MIQIQKSNQAPEVLQTKGSNARRSHSVMFSADPEAFRSGERSFSFSDLYKHPDVKQQLISVQHGKCAFCESKILHVTYGDVEHFRPKAAVRQDPSDDLSRPGYYWLAYDWHNLFLSCGQCNRRYKGNLFPLQDPSARARSHKDTIANEEPLFLHPSEDDPEEHIAFREAVAVAKNGSERGGITINYLYLNRTSLYDVRDDYYRTTFKEATGLIRFLRSGGLTESETREAKRHLKRIIDQNRNEIDETRPFTSMLRCGLREISKDASAFLS